MPDGYVGSTTCFKCHQGISRQFSRTSMGRSLTPVSRSLLETLPTPIIVRDDKLDRYFEVGVKNDKLYQSEYQLDADGKEAFRDTHVLDWIVGSGTNGYGAILDRDDYLFQAPLSFYSKPRAWGPSPGYEFGDYGFNRPILAGCISCHSGRPRPIPATNGKYAEQPFAEMAIGCENCHGPGAAHIHAMETGDTPGNEQTHAIVNPAKLQPELANNICMSCHQTGDIRIFKEGKSYQDFRPGSPLDNTLSILMVPPTRESPPDVDHLQQYYSMTLSKCYRASGARLSCITCHDPHVEPTSEEAPAYFAKKCMTCHTEQSCKLPIKQRQASSPPDNCIACHMPKRDVQVISHSSITSHRILARPGEPFPDEAFQQTTAALRNLIHLDPLPGSKDAPVDPFTLLQAYGELAANKPEYVASYLKVLDQLEQTDPGNALLQAALGRRDLKSGRLQQAVDHLRQAVQIGPPQATYYADLAEATARLGDSEQAISLLRKSIVLDPFNPETQKSLIVGLIHLKQYPDALSAMEHYLEVFPQDTYIRTMLTLAKGGPTKP